MTESLLEEWLEEFESLDQAQLRSFATEQDHNEDIALGIFHVLEERNKYIQLIDPVCSQLFEFYRTREAELQRFTLQFIPVLIRVYLGCVAQGEKRSCRSMETLLIGIYNLEIVDENGQPKAVSFRLPSIAQASIYHEPMTLAPSFLTANALRRLEECNSKLVSWGPLQQVESLNAQNRLKVMTALMFLFNRQLSRLNKLALDYLCKAVTKLVNQGFYRPGHHQRASYGSDSSSGSYVSLRPSPRIPLSSQLLLEFLHALYFAVFNGYDYAGTQAIESVSQRACFEAYPDVQLLANAIRHSLRLNLSGQNLERPSVTSQTTVTTVSKSMITNASFRIKKLPEDIPIQNKEATNDTKNLVSISEEREDEVAAATITEKGGKSQKSSKDKETTSGQKALSKLPTFPGLGKKLQKDKDNKPGNKNGSTVESGTDQQSTKKNPNPTMKDNKGPNRNSAIIANVISINGENDNSDFKNILVRKESGGARQFQSSPITANGPLILEIKNGGGNMMMHTTTGGEMEKVSLVSDSLQCAGMMGHDHGDSSSITNSIDLSARSEDTDSQITTDSVALVTLQDKEQISTIQVSSV